jgi:hypothetical protein
MFSRWLSYCSLVLVLCVSNGAEAEIIGFQSDYAPGKWTSNTNGGSFSSTAPTSISLTSNNAGAGDSNNDFSIILTNSGTIHFNWAYSTADAGGASFDPFGYVLGIGPASSLVLSQLSSDGGGSAQSGSFSVLVFAGQTFGFRQRTIDGFSGSATTTITNFSGPGIGAPAAVPEPASAVALCLGSLALVVRRLRRRSSVVA